MDENQSRIYLKVLRYDNGSYYVNSELIQYCEVAGIQIQPSIPYTPQQNGVTERKNKVLKEMVTYMMDSNNFPPKFWDEAIKCAS